MTGAKNLLMQVILNAVNVTDSPSVNFVNGLQGLKETGKHSASIIVSHPNLFYAIRFGFKNRLE